MFVSCVFYKSNVILFFALCSLLSFVCEKLPGINCFAIVCFFTYSQKQLLDCTCIYNVFDWFFSQNVV